MQRIRRQMAAAAVMERTRILQAAGNAAAAVELAGRCNVQIQPCKLQKLCVTV